MKFQEASLKDLPQIIELLNNDVLGSTREKLSDPLPTQYTTAFEAIDKDPNQELIIVTEDNQIMGTFQLTFIPYLTYQGGLRAQIEAVRIHEDYRGRGIGVKLKQQGEDWAKEQGCVLMDSNVRITNKPMIALNEKLGYKVARFNFRKEI